MSIYTNSAVSVHNPFPVPPVIPAVELRHAGTDFPHWLVRLTPSSIPVAVYHGDSILECAACPTPTCEHRVAVLASDVSPVTDEDVDDILEPIPSPTDVLRAGLDALESARIAFNVALRCSMFGVAIAPDVLGTARAVVVLADALRVE